MSVGRRHDDIDDRVQDRVPDNRGEIGCPLDLVLEIRRPLPLEQEAVGPVDVGGGDGQIGDGAGDGPGQQVEVHFDSESDSETVRVLDAQIISRAGHQRRRGVGAQYGGTIRSARIRDIRQQQQVGRRGIIGVEPHLHRRRGEEQNVRRKIRIGRHRDRIVGEAAGRNGVRLRHAVGEGGDAAGRDDVGRADHDADRHRAETDGGIPVRDGEAEGGEAKIIIQRRECGDGVGQGHGAVRAVRHAEAQVAAPTGDGIKVHVHRRVGYGQRVRGGQPVEVMFQVRVTVRVGVVVVRHQRIHAEGDFPIIGHAVPVGVHRQRAGIEHRPAAHLGFRINDESVLVTDAGDEVRVHRVARQRDARRRGARDRGAGKGQHLFVSLRGVGDGDRNFRQDQLASQRRIKAAEHSPAGIDAVERAERIVVNEVSGLVNLREGGVGHAGPEGNVGVGRGVGAGDVIIADAVERIGVAARIVGAVILVITGKNAPVEDHVVDEIQLDVVAGPRVAAVVVGVKIVMIAHRAIAIPDERPVTVQLRARTAVIQVAGIVERLGNHGPLHRDVRRVGGGQRLVNAPRRGNVVGNRVHRIIKME